MEKYISHRARELWKDNLSHTHYYYATTAIYWSLSIQSHYSEFDRPIGLIWC